MSNALKNRLVGTIILVALAVILLPEFLDGEKQVAEQTFVELPEMAKELQVPPVQPVDIEVLEAAVDEDEAIEDLQPQDGQLNQTLSDQTNSKKQTNTEQTSASIPSSENRSSTTNEQPSQSEITDVQISDVEIEVEKAGWVIQLGSFSDQANVKKLIRSVTTAGYRAYSQPVKTRVGKLTKVFVGPELERSELEKALPHLKEITGLTGKITEYEVSTE